MVIAFTPFWKPEHFTDHCAQFPIGFRGLKLDGFGGAIGNTGIAAMAMMMPAGMFVLHGDVSCGADFCANSATPAAVIGIEALVVFMLNGKIGSHYLAEPASG